MFSFEIGFLSFVGALFFVALYIFVYFSNKAGAWLKGKEQSKEKFGALIVISLVIGFVLGSMLQPIFNKGSQCKQLGRPVVECLFLKGM